MKYRKKPVVVEAVQWRGGNIEEIQSFMAERKILNRIYNCMRIPRYAAGTSSVTVKGVAGYAKDCAYAVPKIQKLLYLLGCGENYDGEIEEELIELEQWFVLRKLEKWN